MPFDFAKWIPLIIGGAQAAGTVLAGRSQAGALDKASELQAAGAKEALDFLKQVYATQRQDMAPYRTVGVNALESLQGWKPGAANKVSLADFTQFKKNAASPGAVPGGSGLAAAGNLGAPTFNDIPTDGIHGRASGVAGRAATGAGLGATIGSVVPGVGTAVGAASGAIYGGLAGLFDNNNADKDFASEGINRVSDWTWNQLMPAVRSGQITPQDAEAAFNQVWGQWESSMTNTPGFNEGVREKSISSQRQYFNPFFSEINRLKQPAVA